MKYTEQKAREGRIQYLRNQVDYHNNQIRICEQEIEELEDESLIDDAWRQRTEADSPTLERKNIFEEEE